MRENRPYGLEGGGTGATGPSYPYFSSAPPGQKTSPFPVLLVLTRLLQQSRFLGRKSLCDGRGIALEA